MSFTANKYADMSPSEFQKRILIPERQSPTFEKDRYGHFDFKFLLYDSIVIVLIFKIMLIS